MALDDDEDDYYFDDFDQDNIFGLYFHAEQEILLRLTCNERCINPTIYADQENAARTVITALTNEFPPNERPESPDGKIDVGFWHFDPSYGAQCNIQALDVPTFNDIENNYAPDVSQRLALLMEHEPEKAGIILWTGIPGTGKTTALRALARAWKERATLRMWAKNSFE